MTAPTNLRLTAKLIPIIAPFIAQGDIRYYLNGINVRPNKSGGAIICATNGHAPGAIHDRDAICDKEIILRLDPRLIQACAAGVKEDRQIVMLDGRLAVIENGYKEIYIQAGRADIDGNFPRYEKVIPKTENLQPGLLGSYSLKLVGLVNRAAAAAVKTKSLRTSNGDGVQFFNVSGDANGPAVARLPNTQDFIAVLMPMRCDPLASPAPAWVGDLQQKDDLAGMASQAVAEEDAGVPA